MTASWDGSGLPPVAVQRLDRARNSSLATSLLSVPSTVSAHAVSLDPVGEVMGCMVHRIGWQGWSGCGVYGMSGQYGSGSFMPKPGFQPYVTAVRNGYNTALSRLSQEAVALGAHGVIDVRLTRERMENDTYEFMAMGTAVRFTDRSDPAKGKLFVTNLPGSEVAALMLAGWLPTAVLYGLALSVRHDDWATYAQTRFSAGNTEVTGFTDLTNHARHQARLSLENQATRASVEGVLVTTSDLKVWEQEPSEGHRDHLAEARMFGTGIVRFRPGPPHKVSPLSILPLR